MGATSHAAATVRLSDLRGTFSPRQKLDHAHVELLAESVDRLPPIVVHAETRKVIDGMHRVAAYRLVGVDEVWAELSSCSEIDAVVEAVRMNTTHGLALSLSDRKRAVQATLAVHPEWSDRRVAEICGVSPKTVGTLRSSTEEVPQLARRVGRDGRVRNANVGRPRTDPCSLDDVIQAMVLEEEAPITDCALQSANGGPALVDWLNQTALGDWQPWVTIVPLSRVYDIARLARERAEQWQRVADALEARATRNS